MSLQRRTLGYRQPLQSNRLQRYVYSEAEFFEALASIELVDVPTTFDNKGSPYTILIAGDIVFNRTIVLNKGINIASVGTGTIRSDSSPIIEIGAIGLGAKAFSFRDLVFAGKSGSTHAGTAIYSTSVSSVFYLSVDRCRFGGVAVGHSSAAGGPTAAFTQLSITNNVWIGTVSLETNGGIISGNQGQANLVIIGALSNNVVITGNNFSSGNITTSASSGGNVIIGNASIGTATLHDSDSFGLNTPVSFLETLTYAASVAIDFNRTLPSDKTMTLTGNLTLTTTNLAPGRSVSLRLDPGASTRTLTLPAGWDIIGGGVPTAIAANKIAMFSLISKGTTDADVVVAYNVVP